MPFGTNVYPPAPREECCDSVRYCLIPLPCRALIPVQPCTVCWSGSVGNRSFPFRALSTARTVLGNHFLTTKLLRLPARLHFAYNPSNRGPPVLLRYLAVSTIWIRWLALGWELLGWEDTTTLPSNVKPRPQFTVTVAWVSGSRVLVIR